MDLALNNENNETQTQQPQDDGDFVIDEDQDIEEPEYEDVELEGQEEKELEDQQIPKKELSISERPVFNLKTQTDKFKSEKFQKKYKKFEGNPQDQLYLIAEKILTLTPSQNSVFEMEAKFGTKGIKQITKIDYDNVIKKLKSLGFTSDDENGNYSLKIQPETIYRGELSVAGKFHLFRVEINGKLNIQEYCKTNNVK